MKTKTQLANELRRIRNKILYNNKPPLEFGTEVEVDIPYIHGKHTVIGRLCGVNDWTDIGDYDYLRAEEERNTIQVGFYRGDQYMIKDFKKYRVLGRPVTLKELLTLLSMRNENKPVIFWVEKDQAFIYMVKKGELNIEYDLFRDPEDQDSEVLRDLIKVLK